jgi:hypothetical protein
VRKRQPRVQRLQHSLAYVSIRQHTLRQHMSAYVSICQYTLAYASICQHTSACRCRHVKKEAACAAPAAAASVPSVKQQ